MYKATKTICGFVHFIIFRWPIVRDFNQIHMALLLSNAKKEVLTIYQRAFIVLRNSGFTAYDLFPNVEFEWKIYATSLPGILASSFKRLAFLILY